MYVLKVPEPIEHYTLDCDLYADERKELEETVEQILSREGMNCSIVDIKVLSGNIEVVSKDAKSELVGALLKFSKCTKRFNWIIFEARLRT